MDLTTIFFIALGLAMDAVAVAISLGLTIKSLKIYNGLIIGLFFGSFQALMPVIGWAAGRSLRQYIVNFDHWIAFGLLAIIGIKMIYESIKYEEQKIDTLSMKTLLMLSIATSIDALAIGISFALFNSEIITPILIIGAVTFVLSFLAVGFGKHAGSLLPKRIEVIGGVILFGIGLKILLEHLDVLSN